MFIFSLVHRFLLYFLRVQFPWKFVPIFYLMSLGFSSPFEVMVVFSQLVYVYCHFFFYRGYIRVLKVCIRLWLFYLSLGLITSCQNIVYVCCFSSSFEVMYESLKFVYDYGFYLSFEVTYSKFVYVLFLLRSLRLCTSPQSLYKSVVFFIFWGYVPVLTADFLQFSTESARACDAAWQPLSIFCTTASDINPDLHPLNGTFPFLYHQSVVEREYCFVNTAVTPTKHWNVIQLSNLRQGTDE